MGSKKKNKTKKSKKIEDCDQKATEHEVVELYEYGRIDRINNPTHFTEITNLYPKYLLSKLFQCSSKFGNSNGKGHVWEVRSKFFFILYEDEKVSFLKDPTDGVKLFRIDIWMSEQLDELIPKNYIRLDISKSFITHELGTDYLMNLQKFDVMKLISGSRDIKLSS